MVRAYGRWPSPPGKVVPKKTQEESRANGGASLCITAAAGVGAQHAPLLQDSPNSKTLLAFALGLSLVSNATELPNATGYIKVWYFAKRYGARSQAQGHVRSRAGPVAGLSSR